ncbi:GNAT family N-acetyltransferase [Epibacterium sp. SM1979]|uniref:GNAT family N-acetyltransferase n=1 Tax=Tritonibacter litoralis TaxID=2662264 RepID=A0A843YIR7_9RHOB|nr:GNAT family N-acetyltransferase [Tritonibacter litoralis]MQQ08627.1 GNAT family N-acetyltransferase [Tritonibacter litoralis]
MTSAPTLETQRLRLRHHVMTDVSALAPYFASDWAQYMGGPISHDELFRWIAAETVSWAWQGFGSWAVTLKDTGALIGQVGINQPPRFPELEIGWCILPDFQRKGYAAEAASAARDWGFANGHTTLVSYIHPENLASMAVARSLGAINDPDAPRPKGDEEDVVYRHSAPDADGSVEAYA